MKRKEPLVLDFLARQGLTLEKYEKTLEKEMQYHYLEAVSKINAASEKALRNAKAERIGSAVLVTVNLEGMVRKGEFPPKGKILNKVQEHCEEKDKLVAVVGFDSTSIQFRVSKPLHAKGFKATKVIGEVKKEFPQASGGGHEQAAAMRFDKDYAKMVLEKTLGFCRKEIEKTLG